MTANVEAMVREGINAYRAGKKAEARVLLLKAVELDQYNEDAWLWLSAAVESQEEARTCLENVLVINPNNEKAKKGIAAMSAKSGGTPAPKPAAPAAPSSPFTMPTDDDDEMPSSLEWDLSAPVASDIPTSSASASRKPQDEPSSQDYDAWVSGLNLGTTGAAPAAPAFDASPFSLDDDNPFGFDDAADPLPVPARPAPATPPPPAPSRRSPVVQPEPDAVDDLFGGPSSADDDDLFSDLGGEDFGEDFGGSNEPDPQEFFRHIPAEITATRLPGLSENYPTFLPTGIAVLVVLNVVALIILFVQMM